MAFNPIALIKLADKANRIAKAIEAINVEELKKEAQDVITEIMELIKEVKELGQVIIKDLAAFGFVIPDMLEHLNQPKKPAEPQK